MPAPAIAPKIEKIPSLTMSLSPLGILYEGNIGNMSRLYFGWCEHPPKAHSERFLGGRLNGNGCPYFATLREAAIY